MALLAATVGAKTMVGRGGRGLLLGLLLLLLLLPLLLLHFCFQARTMACRAPEDLRRARSRASAACAVEASDSSPSSSSSSSSSSPSPGTRSRWEPLEGAPLPLALLPAALPHPPPLSTPAAFSAAASSSTWQDTGTGCTSTPAATRAVREGPSSMTSK